MALVFQDGFATWGYNSTGTANMINSSNMWVSVSSGYGLTTVYPRVTGGASARLASASIAGLKGSLGSPKTASNAGEYIGLGFALRLDTLPTSGSQPFVYFNTDGGDTNCSVWITSAGAILVYRGTTTVLLGSSASGVIIPGVYTHIETKIIIPSSTSATDGAIYVKVNNTQVIGITGTDILQQTSSIFFDTFTITPTNLGATVGNCHIADVVVWDSSGSYVNDWVGNKAVYTFYCDADTATSQWSITGVTQAFDAVDDVSQDGDSTYLAASAAGLTTILEVGTVTSTLSNIKAATLHTLSRQDAAGSSQLKVSLGGTTYTAGADRVVAFPGGTATTYTAYQDHIYQDPDGAGDLTPTLLSAMKVKLERTV